MSKVLYITGNQDKADYFAKFLGFPIDHTKIELDEIQSLDIHEVVEHKVRQAHEIVKRPVLVEDVSLEFTAFGRLPGTFIKHFIQEMNLQQMCNLLSGIDRSATARCVFGYYDGENLQFFEGKLQGKIAEKPAGENGFGWDKIFIPEGYNITRAQMSPEQDKKTYTILKSFEQLRLFLVSQTQ